MKFLLLTVKNLRRNTARTAVTGSALVVLVVIVILIGAIFFSLDRLTRAHANNLKMFVRTRWRIPSKMPLSYVDLLSRGAASRPGDVEPEDWVAWQFYGGTLDPKKLAPEDAVMFIALDPRKLRSMMEDLDQLDPELVAGMVANKRAVLLPREMLQAIRKRVGESFQVTGTGLHKGINLSCEIVGELPEGTYNVGIMNAAYLNDVLDKYPKEHGVKHALDGKRVNLVMLKVTDDEAFRRIAQQIQSCSALSDPPLECQTQSAAIASRLGSHRDLLWGMKWLLLPAVLATMALVVVNAVGISVRERSIEIALLKVLGFRPGQLMRLVLGEAVLVGGASGLLGAGLTLGVARSFFANAELLFVDEFAVPIQALAWGPILGAGTALLGSLAPAWSAGRVSVSETFTRAA